MKKTNANQLWHNAINPIASHCDSTRGAKTAILARMNQASPPEDAKTWNRQQVDSYLHGDPHKRQEPRLGAGLALLEAGRFVMAEHAEAGLRAKLLAKRKPTSQMRKGGAV